MLSISILTILSRSFDVSFDVEISNTSVEIAELGYMHSVSASVRSSASQKSPTYELFCMTANL